MIATRSGDAARAVSSMPEPRSFDAGRAYEHAARLSFPRMVGTTQERRAARSILRSMAAAGLNWRREGFAVPHVARGIGVRLVFAAGGLLVVLGASFGAERPLAAAACWAIAGVLVNSPWKLARGIGSRFPTRMRSENLVGTLSEFDADHDPEAPARVVFMAHYDSKSQILPTGVRVALVVAATGFCGFLTLIALMGSVGATAPLRGNAPAVLGSILLAILGLLAANFTGNRSPGALDNATGVGTLLELAETWRPLPGAPLDVVWVATGAEELGLDGARDFLARHEAWLREKPTLLINLDSVGSGDRLYLSGEPRALRLAGATAERLGLPWSPLRVLGASMDHEPFADRGLAAVSLLGDVVAKSLVFHSSRDQLALVDKSALNRAGKLASHVAWAWAERHRVDAAVEALTV